MFGRLWPVYLIVAVFGTLASAGAGAALGTYAAGEVNPFYGRPHLVTLEGPPSESRAAPQLVAAADLDSQWPVGSVDEEGRFSARP